MKDALKWITSFFFLIAGITRLGEGSAIGLLFLLVSLFAIPPLLAYIEKESNFQLPRAAKYLVIVFAFVMVAATDRQQHKAEPVASVDTTIQPVQASTIAPKDYSIISDVETFRKRFNSFTKDIDNGSLRIKSLSISDGPVNNSFMYMLTKNIGIVGQLNKSDNSIRSLFLTMQGDGTIESGVNILTTIMAVVDSTNPGLTPDERGRILKRLGLFKDGVDLTDVDSRTTKNGISYSLKGSELFGLMFTVGNEEDDSE